MTNLFIVFQLIIIVALGITLYKLILRLPKKIAIAFTALTLALFIFIVSMAFISPETIVSWNESILEVIR